MSDEVLRKPAVHAKHVAMEAKFGDEAGWEVPLSYGDALGEVEAVRSRAGVFDVSHVGRIRIRGNGALDLLERICTHDVAHQEDDTAVRTLLCNERGGILADGLLVRTESFWILTCSPCCREKVLEHLAAQAADFDVKFDDQTTKTAMLTVAGPAAPEMLDAVLPIKVASLPDGAVKVGSLMIARYMALRTGVTGTWSLEVILPNMVAGQAWRFITQKAGDNCIAPAGMAARDVLRIEAGRARYGHELNETIDPITAGLEAMVDFEHEFLGRGAIVEVRDKGAARKRVGLILTMPTGKPGSPDIPRLGAPVLRAGGGEVGTVTSGTYSPTLEKVIAMAYVAPDVASVGTELQVSMESGPAGANVAELPFVRP
jgi:aminomethyltransferase